MSFELVAIAGLSLIVLLLGILVAGLLRGYAEVIRRLDSLGLDDNHPSHGLIMPERKREVTPGARDISGVDPDGQPTVVSTSIGDDPILISFLSTSCNSCTEFWERLDRPFISAGKGTFRSVIVLRGPEEESPTRAQGLRAGPVDVVMSSQAWIDYEVPGAPYFVLVEPGAGVSGEGSAGSFESLSTFLSDSTGDQAWDRRVLPDSDRDNPQRIDNELRAAGILPGDESLYPTSSEDSD